MLAKKCDICGAYYSISDSYSEFQLVKNVNGIGPELYDLCEKCQNRLLEFVTRNIVPESDIM